jgi:hypothetical protein
MCAQVALEIDFDKAATSQERLMRRLEALCASAVQPDLFRCLGGA